LVEHYLAKVVVASSSLVARSRTQDGPSAVLLLCARKPGTMADVVVFPTEYDEGDAVPFHHRNHVELYGADRALGHRRQSCAQGHGRVEDDLLDHDSTGWPLRTCHASLHYDSCHGWRGGHLECPVPYCETCHDDDRRYSRHASFGPGSER
jgi:hypothetical protein